jgi:hypothetical protein
VNLLSTIRGRLRLGFGITVVLILAAGGLAIVGLQRAGRRSEALIGEMRFEQESVQNVAYRILQEVAAGMRYLDTGAASDGERYTALAEQADSLRRAAVKLGALSSPSGRSSTSSARCRAPWKSASAWRTRTARSASRTRRRR